MIMFFSRKNTPSLRNFIYTFKKSFKITIAFILIISPFLSIHNMLNIDNTDNFSTIPPILNGNTNSGAKIDQPLNQFDNNVVNEVPEQENNLNDTTLEIEITNTSSTRYPSWYELARNRQTAGPNGTLQVNSQAGSIVLEGTYIEVYNITGEFVTSGFTDSNGNYSVDLEPFNYTIIASEATNITLEAEVNSITTTTVLANFGQLRILAEGETSNPVDATIELEDAFTSVLVADGINTGALGNVTINVAPNTYDVLGFYGYGQSNPSVIVSAGELVETSFTFGGISGKFGGISVNSTGYMGMPITSSVAVYDYTTGSYVTGGTTNADTGIWSDTTIAPDVYRMVITEANTITFSSVSVEAEIQTNFSVSFGLLIVYQDNTTNTRVDIYDETNTFRHSYHYISGTTKLLAVHLSEDEYTIRYSGKTHSINLNATENVTINSQINTAPSRVSVTASPERINENEETNITVKMTDINYDYANISFTWTPNTGSISGIDQNTRFTGENELASTVTYHAPAVLTTMYIDILVEDHYSANFTFRIYVANRTNTIYVNSTELNGVGKYYTQIRLYRTSTNVQIGSYQYTNTTGWVKFTNIWEDEYYLRAHEHNYQYSENFALPIGSNHYYNFKWAVLRVNSTALNNELIDTYVTVYKHLASSSDTGGTTTISDQGYYTFYIGEGEYDLVALEFNSIKLWNLSVTAEEETFYTFRFGVFAIYYLDDDGLPQNKRVDVYNYTTSVRFSYAYMTDGLLVIIVAPFNNYSIKVDHNSTYDYFYEPESILPNEGRNIGAFINHAPTIDVYSALPSRIGPDENSTITITATDPDPLDILTYVYIPSVGTISGSGEGVTYFAPSSWDFYYLNISVVDPSGAFDNITRSISDRTTDISIDVEDFESLPLYYKQIRLYDWTTGVQQGSYQYTNVAGNVFFDDVPESFYYIRATASNYMFSDPFIGLGNTQYNHTFSFSTLFVNSTAGNNQLIETYTYIFPNGSTTSQASGSTTLSDHGQIRYDLRPDYYYIRGDEANQLFIRDIDLFTTSTHNLTFQWSELNVTSLSAFSMPLSSRVDIYNHTSNSRYTYFYLPSTTGQTTTYVAPGDDYRIQIAGSNTWINYYTTYANQITDVEGRFALLKVSQTDTNGDPLDVSIQVQNATTGTYIAGGSTGADGVIVFHLVQGTYDIFNSSTTFDDIFLTESIKNDIDFGSSEINNSPTIYSVTSTPSRIGANSSTTILIQIQDIDNDFDTMNVNFDLSAGSLGSGSTGWIQSDIWYYQIDYYSPSILGLYQINITVDDSRGGMATYMLVVSERDGTFNIFSKGNAYKDITTSFNIYRVSNGQSVYSGSTSNGILTRELPEDLYRIIGYEHNTMTVEDIWLGGGSIVNVTFLWGELTVYSTGVGGVPIQGTRVNVYDQFTGVRYTYTYTDAEGKVHFILAPGIYRIELVESSTIEFNNVEIIGGSSLALGSEVPSVTRPDDIVYVEYTTGNVVSWILSDDNPGYYHVEIDGITWFNSSTWSNEENITISIDGLSAGSHYIVLFVNDTLGYEQYDLVYVTVTVDSTSPQIVLNSPSNQSHIQNTVQIVITTNESNCNITYNWDSSVNQTPNVGVLIDPPMDEGLHYLYVYINDLSGNTAFSVFTFTVDDTPPLIYNSLTNNSVITSSMIANITSNEQGVVIEYKWDLGSDYIFDSETGIAIPTIEGNHSLTVQITDLAGNIATETYNYFVDDTYPDIIVSLENNSIIQSSEPLSISSSEENYTVIYSWNLGTNQTGSNEQVIAFPNIDGIHNLTVIITDLSGNSVKSFFEYTVDDTTPLIYSSVLNNSAVTSSMLIYITSNEQDVVIEYKWDNSLNQVYNNEFGIDVPTIEGSHSLIVQITDLAGNIAKATFDYDVDNIYPDLIISPINNSIIQSSETINISSSEISYLVTYSWNLGTNQTGDNAQVISVPTQDGSHNLTVIITDLSGNSVIGFFIYTIDNTAPLIEPSVVEDDEVGTGDWIPFEINDTHFEEYWYFWTNDENESLTLEKTTVPGVMAPSEPGEWTLTVYANDTAGNIAEISLSLVIMQAVPLTLLYPVSGDTITGFCYITWATSESIDVDVYYSPNDGYNWFIIAESVSYSYTIWDTSQVANGDDYLIRLVSVTTGQPGETHSESTFSVYNDQSGTIVHSLPYTQVNLTLSGSTNMSIVRFDNVSDYMFPNSSYLTLGLFVEVVLDHPEYLISMSISFNYEDIESLLISKGMSYQNLSVFFYNETSANWELADAVLIDPVNKIITGVFNHTTVIGALGKSQSTPSSSGGGDPLLVLFVFIIFAAALGGGYAVYSSEPLQEKLKELSEAIMKRLRSGDG